MLKEGYQPNKGKLDVSNPPQGGSGIPDKENIYKKMWESLKTAKCKGDKALEVSLKALMKDIENKYLIK